MKDNTVRAFNAYNGEYTGQWSVVTLVKTEAFLRSMSIT